MADKNSVTDWSETAGDNDNVGGVPLGENVMLPSNVNNAFRVMMAQLKAFFKSSVFRVRDSSDETKLLALDLSGLTTATTRTQIVPDENGRQALQPHLAGHLYGLTLSNNVTDATNDIDIAAGLAIDSTNTHVMTLASAITKRLDAAWAVGSGNGGLDTGSIANTTYHVHLIKRVDTGVVDVLFSASATAPTLPASYTIFRRIGSIIRASAAIVLFYQRGDNFYRKINTADVSTTTLGTGGAVYSLSVPTGIGVEARVSGYMSNAATSNSVSATSVTPAGAGSSLFSLAIAQVANVPSQFDSTLATDTNGNIYVVATASNTTFVLTTYGWADTRGR